jgi:DNA repair protein RecO (recombination protein O)
MLLKTKGIVFRSVKYGESSLILDIYTRELGLKTYVINGVRKRNARVNAAALQVMSILDLEVYEHSQKEINRIKEVKPAYIYREIPFKVEKSAVGLFITEIVRKNIREKEQNQYLFEFLEHTFTFLDQTLESTANFHLAFLLSFAKALGFGPDNNYSENNCFFDLREGLFQLQPPFHPDYLDETDSKLLDSFINCDLNELHTISLSKAIRVNLLENLIKFYKIQLGDFGKVKSLEVYKDIFS